MKNHHTDTLSFWDFGVRNSGGKVVNRERKEHSDYTNVLRVTLTA